MKKIVLLALNSRFIHSNTAVWSMHAALKKEGMDSVVESFTVNHSQDKVMEGVMRHKPSTVCVSCYIWNMRMVEDLVSMIKAIDNDMKIVLGGPEVSFGCEEILRKTGADCIIRGEGEDLIARVADRLSRNEEPCMEGVAYLKTGRFVDGGYHTVPCLEGLESPFSVEMLEAERDKILYYETSRGCLYNCIYCLSSCTKGIRYFPLDRVFPELARILGHSPRQIKFVDRTFNADKQRTLEMVGFLKNIPTGANFHMEIHPDLLDGELIRAFSGLRPGLIQMEAGIQTSNVQTLQASGRHQNTRKALDNMEEVIKVGNIHVHLDLMAGLPYDSLETFRESFDLVMDIRPHVLQLGFLKMLKGTLIRDMEGYLHADHPPYEVLQTPWMSWEDLHRLKQIQECFDIFYNSGKFVTTLCHADSRNGSPFDFYLGMSRWMQEQGYGDASMGPVEKYRILHAFLGEGEDARERLRFDYMSCFDARAIPDFLVTPLDDGVKEKLFTYLKKNDPGCSKQRYKHCFASTFVLEGVTRTYFFDHSARCPVTGRYPSMEISF
ncbi:MAG: DUF4080 domain-containing protein [Clostridia bacterium]